MSHLSRRRLLQAALAVPVFAIPAATRKRPTLAFPDVTAAPTTITAISESGSTALSRNGSEWGAQGIAVRLSNGAFSVRAAGIALTHIRVRWNGAPTLGLAYLGDAWERSYGDLGWRGLDPERVLPWYFLASNISAIGGATIGIGVKTGASAFCYWRVDDAGLTLVLDVRNGGRGVLLGDRELLAATVVTERFTAQSAFSAAKHFCRRMCEAPRLPAAPVYGGNNWYYAYGKSSAEDIRRDSQRIAEWSPTSGNRPFMVIDDGWSPFPTAGPWDRGNAKFPDMPALAADMRKIGVRPGIWVRPLITQQAVPDTWKLNSPGAKREAAGKRGWTVDPTVPEVLRQVRADIERVHGWGYELIKHDFSTYDLLGRWGFTMGAALTDDGWSFADRTRTNAEITGSFYRAIREAAGDALVLGCNTVGHLSAGLFELQRTGDDTSGREWNRTRKMGVNTLAFRAPQYNAFFAIDADCAGITRQVPWSENRQWLDLLSRSGTPLFVSAAPDAMGPEQQQAVREAFARAAAVQPLGEPLDWMQTTQPSHWKFGAKEVNYRWFLD